MRQVWTMAALVATWTQNLAFMSRPDSGGIAGFIAAATKRTGMRP